MEEEHKENAIEISLFSKPEPRQFVVCNAAGNITECIITLPPFRVFESQAN